MTYDRATLKAMFALASRGDVEEGGVFDARGGAINIWSKNWKTKSRRGSYLVGTVSVTWDDPCSVRFDEEVPGGLVEFAFRRLAHALHIGQGALSLSQELESFFEKHQGELRAHENARHGRASI